ncbi:MAG: VCBS repeat-containing protein, partial [Pirellulaceae bacterium]
MVRSAHGVLWPSQSRLVAQSSHSPKPRRSVIGQAMRWVCLTGVVGCFAGSAAFAHEPTAHEPVSLTTTAAESRHLETFERQILTEEYYSEGIGWGDLSGDGSPDVVYGPHWYEGPDFTKAREIYPAKPQNRQGYSDHFFHWVRDFNGDGLGDVLIVGFPGTPSYVYENPGEAGWDQSWPRHEVIDSVGNEAPQFV